MYTLYADVEFSRRKRLHHILNEQDEPVWSGQRIADAFAWFIDNDENEFRLEGGGPQRGFTLTIQPD